MAIRGRRGRKKKMARDQDYGAVIRMIAKLWVEMKGHRLLKAKLIVVLLISGEDVEVPLLAANVD
ncbi:hypothetical protein CCACVL1_28051 [Corchorus capsularis]|uniref:Uncharacterized protein n=1 Tax=Corchorus capsularis TaxID=210143 RepID=A0A1R3G7M2_COCAP|nr:hypothetical protein CCACVL1_28051 [Corchorus capsularis]